MKVSATVAMLLCTAMTAHAGYWSFCDDYAGTENCGEGVDDGNDGCLVEPDRKSVVFAGGSNGFYLPVFVAYTDDNCQNEVGCNAVDTEEAEGEGRLDFSIPKWQFGAYGNSFKFMGGSPAECPNGCAGQCAKHKRSRAMDQDYVEADVQEDLMKDKREASGGTYYFCDDTACSVNCGATIEVNPSQPGSSDSPGTKCDTNEANRKSAFFQDLTDGYTVILGGYPNNNCSGVAYDDIECKDGCCVLDPFEHPSWAVIGYSPSN